MSRKIQSFTKLITTPLNTHNFLVSIPGLEDYNITVQSTTFPSEKLRKTKLYIAGEEVRYAAVPTNSGEWAIKIPESDDGTISKILEEAKRRLWSQTGGELDASALTWNNIRVMARDLNGVPTFDVTLHGAWIMGRNDVSLSASAPETNWQWDYMFTYQWLEDNFLR